MTSNRLPPSPALPSVAYRNAGRLPTARAWVFLGESMKIVAGKVIVTCPGRNFVTLKLLTDQGLYGIGDATLNGRELAVVSYLEEHVLPCLVGRDPQQIEDIWQYL